MRVAAGALLLVVGAAAALAAVLVHGHWWGTVLLLLALVATLTALPPGWWSRVAFAVGWVAVLAWSLQPRPEGDFLVASTPKGYLVLASGLLAVTWAIATLPRRRGRLRDAADHGEVGTAS